MNWKFWPPARKGLPPGHEPFSPSWLPARRALQLGERILRAGSRGGAWPGRKSSKYFDFAQRRRSTVVLYDIISALTIAVTNLVLSIAPTLAGTGIAYGIGVVAAYAIVAAAVMGLNMAVSSLTSKSGKQGSLSSGSVMMNTRMVTDPIKVVYGKRRIGASQVFIHTEGSLLNTYMHMIAVWGEGPVNGVAIDGAGEMIWIGERRIQELQNYFGENYVTHTFKNGSSDQAVDANLAAIFPAFADAMRYTAYSYFKFRFSQLLYSGFPQVTATIEGRTLFDPRDGSISYSTNPALVWRDFKSHPRYGGGIAGSLIDSQSVEDAATWCENNSYVFNGAISDRQSFLDTIEDILMNFRGEEIWSGGQYKLLIQTYSTPVMALDEKDIKIDDSRKNALGIQTAGIQDSPTRVKVTFGDIALNYTPNYAYWPQVPIVVSEGVELDRGTKEVELIGVTTYTQALKIAKYLFLKARWSRAFSAIVHPRLLALELGDMVSVSHNTAIPLGSIPEDWSNKVLRIASCAMTQDNQISVVFGEESLEIYDDTVEETTPHYAYNTTTPSFFDAPPDPDNLTFNTGPDEQTSQKIDAYIDFFWDSMGNGLDYILRWRYDTVTTWTSHSVMKPMAVIGIPTPGTAALILQTSGEYSGTITKYYKVEIDGDGSPNTFKWSDDGGLTWEATGVEINPLAWQILNDGVRAKFNADTGGVLGDNFTFTATPRDINAERIGGLQCGKTVYWQIQAINDKNIKSEWITPNFPAMTWDPDAPTMGDVTLGSLSEGNSVLLKWTKAASDNELSEWIVYRNHVNDAPTAIILYHKYIKSRSYVDLTVITGVTYYYWLKCIDRFNRISSSFSNVTEIQFIHGVRSLAFETVGSGDIPAVDGAIGLIGTDVIGLENCDDYTHFTHDAADPQDILLGQETGDVKEGTGSLKISLSEYYTKFSFEETNEFYYGVTYRIGQNWGWKQYYSKGFKPTESLDCKAIGLKLTKTGAPENLIVEIYSDNAGKPGASLGSATLLSASVGTTLGAPPNDYTYAIFGTPISLTSGTLYHIVLNTQGIHLYDFYNIYGWYVINGTVNHFGDATERDYSSDDGTTWGLPFLDAYGNYDMNFKLCKASAALNKYVWATIAAKDISLKTYLKFWTKAARTGTNFQISFGESAIEEQLFNVPISVANTWEFKAISLSGVLAADRNAVTKIGIKITNVDESNIIYLDNIFCNIATPHPQIYIDGEWKRFVLEDDPSIAPGAPTGLTATATFTYIILDWTNPITSNIQYVEISRSNTNDRAAASVIATIYGDNYWDLIGTSGETRYYWIRAKNLNGAYSAWLPLGETDGVWATTIGLNAGDFDTTPPAIPTGLGLTTGVSQGADGTEYSWIRADWTANTESDLSHYEYRIKETGGNYSYGFVTSNDVLFSPVRSNILHYIGIRAIDKLANKSAFCTDVSKTSSKDTTLPAVPTSFAAVSSFKTIFLTWINPTNKDLSHINIYRGTTSTRGSASLIAKVKGTFYADEMPSPYYGLLRYYWIDSEDTSANVSATEAGPVNATTAQVATADMENLSVVNAKIGLLAVDDANINNVNAGKINAGDVAAARMQVQGGNAINAGSVNIDPGRVLISGAVTLSDWRHGTDATKIDGGDIYANTITANKIAIGSRNLSIQGIEISAQNPTANTLYWAGGVISYIQDDGTSTDGGISSGSQLWSSGTLYLYWVKDAGSLSTTTTRATAFGANNVVLASYRGGTDLVVNYGRTIVDGSDIITGTLTGDRLVANTIAAGQLSTGELITLSAQIKNGIIESVNIKNLTVDSAKMANLTVGTDKITGQAVTRGVQYYNAAGYTFPSYQTYLEYEIGTVTVVTNENTDYVWIWSSVQVTQCFTVLGKDSQNWPAPIEFRIRRDSITGEIIAGGRTMGGYDAAPMILIGTDQPGGSAGNHVYKLTGQHSGVGTRVGIVAYRKIMALAKSR